MIRPFLYALLFTLAGLLPCTRTQAQTHAPSQHTAKDMADLYRNTATDCGDSSKPAFMCSGIIIRGATSGATWNSWSVSPTDLKLDGVSFGYLRKDIPYDFFKSGVPLSGFTIFPLSGPYNAPTEKHVMQVLCAFPLDGWTDERDQNGCGVSQMYGARSAPCQTQGILTADQWVKHDSARPRGNNSNRSEWQCGFDVHAGSQYNTADAFMQFIKARNQLGPVANFDMDVELRIASWQDVPLEQLPIQSFFYAVSKGGSNAKGLADARLNQKAYFDQTKIFVPIVQIVAPGTVRDLYDFRVFASDQAVPFPA